MTIHKKGQAHWEGDIKRGKGTISTERCLEAATLWL